jgi:hypothetical protein
VIQQSNLSTDKAKAFCQNLEKSMVAAISKGAKVRIRQNTEMENCLRPDGVDDLMVVGTLFSILIGDEGAIVGNTK